MKAIIVDDEPKAIDLLRSYLSHFRAVELAATFRNGLKAFEYLNSHAIDLIFLDIDMPHISGISLAKMIDKKINIIFTTAYSDYAVESYEVSAVDYLLKPVSLERFMQAMGKVLNQQDSELRQSEIIWIKSGGKKYKLLIDEILYLYKEGNYLTYFTHDTKVIARETIGEALHKLPSYFCQSHKSYIINLRQVTALEKERIFIDKVTIPIGSTHREMIRDNLKNFFE
ncbi:MAG: response regulator transcription factor [Saprospiraceae bacterium]|nr:response regulator transcription factor [Saprospiraceae bacterium]